MVNWSGADRRDIYEGRFAKCVRDCPVLEFDTPVSIESLCAQLAEAAAPLTGLDAATIAEAMLGRERLSPTAYGLGCALPHGAVPGEHIYQLVLARANQGVTYPEPTPSVCAVLANVFSADERIFNMHAVAMIAKAVQGTDFGRLWCSADGPDALRNLLLEGAGLA